jgi:acyl-CoA reductase-like NAD-dependent aldehyde dehydrogenase
MSTSVTSEIFEARTLIGEDWLEGSTTIVASPFDGSTVGKIHNSTPQHVSDAIDSAADAGKAWAKTPAHQRASILQAVTRLMEEHADELARLMTLQTGKTLREAKNETIRSISAMEISAEEAKRVHGEMIPMDAVAPGVGKIGFTIRVPVGVVAGITPFNAPLSTLCHKLGPALAAGNTLVVKPHPHGSGVTALLGRLVLEAGVPPGVFNIVHGGADVGAALVEDERVALVNFTGSGKVADLIIRSIGLKRVLLELGGNAPTIVHGDADLDKAVPQCIEAGFGLTGQSCISTQRIYVQRAVYDEFVERFVAGVRSRKLGDPLDPSTDTGPMINEASAIRIEQWIKEAVADGARLRCGGERNGTFLAPTVLTDVNAQMKVVCDEVFGPVVTVSPYETLDEALAWANATPWGLKSGIFTRSLDVALTAAQQLAYGTVNINAASRARTDQEPSGGVKQSGWGKEGPRHAIEEMTDVRMITIAAR